MFRFLNLKSTLTLIIFVLSIFCIQAFDGIFFNKSYLAIHYERVFNDSLTSQPIFKDFIKRDTGGSWQDIGGSAYQTNLIPFVAKNSSSFFWTDKIAAGNGILEDLTFQPFSIVNLWSSISKPSLKKNQISFILLLACSFLAMFFLLKDAFKVNSEAALIGSLIYLFSGFVTSGWSNHVQLPYIFLPIMVLSFYYYIHKRINFFVALLITAIFLLNTFLPTLLLSIIGSFIIIVSYVKTDGLELKKVIFKLLLLYLTASALLCFYYIPALSQFFASGSGEIYSSSNRVSMPVPWQTIYLFLGPHHPWKNFNSLHQDNYFLWAHWGMNFIYIGTTAVYLIFYGLVNEVLKLKKNSHQFSFNFFLFIVFGIFLSLYTDIYKLIIQIPLIGSISRNYYNILISVCFSFVAALGAYRFITNFNLKHAALSYLAIILIVLSYLYLAEFPHIKTYRYSLFFYIVFIPGLIFYPFKQSIRGLFLLVIVCLELFILQNHTKVDFQELDEIKLKDSIVKLQQTEDINNYRIFNTSFNLLPPNVSAALGFHNISTIGHLSQDESYNRLYREHLGSDTILYPLHGYTNCQNLTVDHNFLNELSVKYILTDRGHCSTHFINKFPIKYQDDYMYVFENTSAKPIVSFEGNSDCKITQNNYQLKREYSYENCSGKLALNINFKEDFKYKKNGQFYHPQENNPIGKIIYLEGTGKLEVLYSNIYKYSIIASLLFAMIIYLFLSIKFFNKSKN